MTLARAQLLVLVAAVAACNQNIINTPTRSFDRPSDVALTCVQGNLAQNQVYDPHPLSDCDPNVLAQKQFFIVVDPTNPTDGGVGEFDPQLRAVVANSTRGELALVDVLFEQLIDEYPSVPGYGFVPVGALPEHVRISDDGCTAVTANVNSCDLAVVDMAVMHNLPRRGVLLDGGVPVGSPILDPKYGDNIVRRLVPTVNGVPLGAKPSWIELAPESTPALRGFETGGTPGICIGGRPLAWVALPGCELVVEVDLSATAPVGPPGHQLIPAEVVRALRVTPTSTTVVANLAALSCPAECAGDPAAADAGTGVPVDLGQTGAPTDGGVPPRLPKTQAFPSDLTIDLEGGVGRMFIGDQVSGRISVVPINPLTGTPGAPRAITLAENPVGVDVVRVSPRSEAGKFLYAVARDGSVRVVDLDREVECETNPDPRDPRLLPPDPSTWPLVNGAGGVDDNPQPSARQLGCFPLGAPGTPARSPLASSPGIVLQNGALPKDVAFVHLDVIQPPFGSVLPPSSAGPRTMVGDFAWVIGSDGRGLIIDLFDACPEPNVPQPPTGPTYTPACDLTNADPSRILTNQLPGRPVPTVFDRLAHRPRLGTDRFFPPTNCGDNAGAPRIQDEANPITVVTSGTGPTGPDAGVSPSFPKLVAEILPPVSGAVATIQCASAAQRSVAFYDVDHVRNETWSLAWEGLIPTTTRTVGAFATGDASKLRDSGGAYCTRGVQAGDKVVLIGCTKDDDCDFTQSCARATTAPPDVVNGLCLDNSTPQILQDLTTLCAPLLGAVLKYRILSAKQGGPTSNGQVDDELTLGEIDEPEYSFQTRACKDDSDCTAVTVPIFDVNGKAVSVRVTRCLADTDDPKSKTCLLPCSTSDRVALKTQQCSTDFQCHVSRQGDERCMRAPLDNLLFASCITELQPYEVHVGSAFAMLGSSSGFFSDLEPQPGTGECGLPPNAAAASFVRLRQSRIPIDPGNAALPPCPAAMTSILAPLPNGFPRNVCLFSTGEDRQVHFENPLFAIGLDVPSPNGRVPFLDTVQDLSLSFVVVGGQGPLFVNLGVDVQAQLPRAVVVGPDRQTLYVIDEGKQTTATGLRGQLLRVSSVSQATDRTFQVR